MGEIIAERYALLDFRGENGLSRSYLVEDLLLQKRAFIKLYPYSAELGLDYLKTVTAARDMGISCLLLPEEAGILDGDEETLLFALFPELRVPSLERYLSVGFQISGAEALRICRETIACLGEMHERGLLHLFIHPRNLLYRPSGRIFLKDACLKGEFLPFVLEKLTRPDFTFFSPRLMDGKEPAPDDDLCAAGKLFQWISGNLPWGPERRILEHLADLCSSSREVNSILEDIDKEYDLLLGSEDSGWKGETPPPSCKNPDRRSTRSCSPKDEAEEADSASLGPEMEVSELHPGNITHGGQNVPHHDHQRIKLIEEARRENESYRGHDRLSFPSTVTRKRLRFSQRRIVSGITLSALTLLFVLFAGVFSLIRQANVKTKSSWLISSADAVDSLTTDSMEGMNGVSPDTDELGRSEPGNLTDGGELSVDTYSPNLSSGNSDPSSSREKGRSEGEVKEHKDSIGQGSQGTVPNRPPVASFTISPVSGASPLRILCDASGSHDPDGNIISWRWSFGMEGIRVYWVVESQVLPAKIPISLTVTDDAGVTSTETRYVTVY